MVARRRLPGEQGDKCVAGWRARLLGVGAERQQQEGGRKKEEGGEADSLQHQGTQSNMLSCNESFLGKIAALLSIGFVQSIQSVSADTPQPGPGIEREQERERERERDLAIVRCCSQKKCM